MGWQRYEDVKPQPGTKFVLADFDGCSAGMYAMLDDGPYDAEDGQPAQSYLLGGLWMALPSDFPIAFMEVTEDDWY